MKPFASKISVGEPQTTARIKELLETLELLASEKMPLMSSAQLMGECMAQLRSAQLMMEKASIDAEIVLERAAAIESG